SKQERYLMLFGRGSPSGPASLPPTVQGIHGASSRRTAHDSRRLSSALEDAIQLLLADSCVTEHPNSGVPLVRVDEHCHNFVRSTGPELAPGQEPRKDVGFETRQRFSDCRSG